jgi:TolA-binding protein
VNHIDLHPEDLIDKEIAGELSSDEASRLEAHVLGCDACRFERLSRADFREEFAARGQRARISKMVANVMLTRTATPPVPVVIAAALLVVGFATAAGWSASKRSVDEPRDINQSSRELVTTPAPTVTVVSQPAIPVVVAPVVSASSEPVVALPSASAPIEKSAATLFAEANDARARGDYGVAIAAYSQIESRHGSTPEGNATRVILGRLLLDRGDAAGALERFDAYLRSGEETLREEAMVGRAASLEKLGRLEDAANAWSAFLDMYPNSVHAPRAKSRLGALRP